MFGPLYVESDTPLALNYRRREIRKTLDKLQFFFFLELAMTLLSVLLYLGNSGASSDSMIAKSCIFAIIQGLSVMLYTLIRWAVGQLLAYQWEKDHPLP